MYPKYNGPLSSSVFSMIEALTPLKVIWATVIEQFVTITVWILASKYFAKGYLFLKGTLKL